MIFSKLKCETISVLPGHEPFTKKNRFTEIDQFSDRYLERRDRIIDAISVFAGGVIGKLTIEWCLNKILIQPTHSFSVQQEIKETIAGQAIIIGLLCSGVVILKINGFFDTY